MGSPTYIYVVNYTSRGELLRNHALIYDSRPLNAQQRFQHWYQWSMLGVSLASAFLPIAYYIFIVCQYKWRQYRARPVKIHLKSSDHLSRLLDSVVKEPYHAILEVDALSKTVSYAFWDTLQPKFEDNIPVVDLLLSIPINAEFLPSDVIGLFLVAYCDPQVMLEEAQTSHEDEDILRIMHMIHKRCSVDSSFRGIVLRLSNMFTPQQWMTLAQHLRRLNFVVLMELHPPYTDLIGMNLTLIDGLIIRNATILQNGLRRDFFRGFELRDVLARCNKQKTSRPGFTTILHDPCQLPSTPTLRRAYKFARFHEVLLAACHLDLSEFSACLPMKEPQSAFDWLKRLEVLDLHRRWNEAVVFDHGDEDFIINLTGLDRVLPGIEASFVKEPFTYDKSQDPGIEVLAPDWIEDSPVRISYFSIGENGQDLSTLACYDLRDQITDVHVSTVLKTQIHMRTLALTQELSLYELQEVLDYFDPVLKHLQIHGSLDKFELSLIIRLIDFLKNGSVKIYRGLDSGFMLPENRFHMWSVLESTPECSYIYVSQMATNLSAVILHTFLLNNGISRRRSFEIELILASVKGDDQDLPDRVLSELRQSTHAELLTHLQQIRLSKDAECSILTNVVRHAKYLLIEETTKSAWKRLHGEMFLGEKIAISDLLQSRLEWLAEQGNQRLPRLAALLRMYRILEYNIVRALRDDDSSTIDVITSILCESYESSCSRNEASVEQDITALMVFCVFRKYGVEETYLESSDRCPVYHFQTDQPGVFSELWVIGSQCEVYFDVTPGILGAMHYARYRHYLQENPPPAKAWNGVDVFTAYHKVETPTSEGTIPGDAEVTNPFAAKNAVFFPRLQKFAFLSVFCLPAVCDVMLLVFLGRGVFQTAFMKPDEVQYSTLGLLTALLLCSGTIAWSGSSGGYYLYNAAFDSLNHVMVQKLSGAFCLTSAVAVLGGLGIGGQQGWYPGLIFFLYLMAISTYLNILGILATMHRDGSPLPSGRSTLWKSLPILLISPILSTFVHGYDIVIYLVVLYTFLTALYINYRKLCAEWSQFYTKISCIEDRQVLTWYRSRLQIEDDVVVDFEVARKALEVAVLNTRREHALPWKSKSDGLEAKLAPGLEYSRWLLKKDAGPGAAVPEPFSSAWNNQLKVSLNTYQNFVRGLKEHSGFLQFRYAKNDIAYNVVMFIAALLDRWISITMSAAGDGPLNLYKHPRNRFAISFALAYFLTSAVALDYQLQFCWTAVVATSARSVESSDSLEVEETREMGRKKRLYWNSLRDLFTIMLALFGIWTLLLIFWVEDGRELIQFLAYAVSYTCVLWFQFNRVFIKDGTTAFLIVVAAIATGYCAGIVLHLVPRTYNFQYIDVICMGLCNFLAGIGSFCAAEFGSSRDEVEDDIHSPQDLMHKTGWKTHSQKHIGLDWNASLQLSKALNGGSFEWDYRNLLQIKIDRHPELVWSLEKYFLHARPTPEVIAAFPTWNNLLQTTLKYWKSGKILLYLTSTRYLSGCDLNQVSAIGRLTNNEILEVCIPVIIMSDSWLSVHHTDIAQQIGEAMLHEACELLFHMSHADAVCAELILASKTKHEIPRRMMEQLHNSLSVSDVQRMAQRTNAEILKHCCLGIEVNVQWTRLPQDLRQLIVSRVVGDSHVPEAESSSFISTHLASDRNWPQVLARSDSKMWLARKIQNFCSVVLEGQVIRQRNLPTQAMSQREIAADKLSSSNSWHQRAYYAFYTLFQYIAVVSNGDPDVPRELHYRTRSTIFRTPLRTFVLAAWRLCAACRRFSIELTLLHSRPELTDILTYCRKGISRQLYADRIVINDPFNPVTGFFNQSGGGLIVSTYPGKVDKLPTDESKQSARGQYNSVRRLIQLDIYDKGTITDTSKYIYDNDTDGLPRARDNKHGRSYYDLQGRVSHGTAIYGDQECTFQYLYTPDDDCADVLKADYVFTDLSIFVFWCVPRDTRSTIADLQLWLPTKKVSKIIYVQDDKRWEIQYTYHHKRDPTIICAHVESQGQVRYLEKVPEWITKDPHKLATKPILLHFDTEDLLFRHPTHTSVWRRALHALTSRFSSVRYSPLDSGTLRTILWSRWHKSKSLDGVTACYVDTQILRHEKYLARYWTLRETGHLSRATRYLDDHLDAIIARIDIDDSVSQNTFLPYKMSDLYTMGTGGSANVKTRRYEENYSDSKDRLSVMFLDTGCFPDQPGGVSNCRRDLVNGHTTIRNHVFTESANDFGVPRYQVDKNVQSVKVLPLWGLDYLSPYHGLFENLLDSQVLYREHHTTEKDIQELFLPILRRLVKGARTLVYSQEDLVELTQAFVDLSIYFEEKDYLKTWKSNHVKRCWRQSWLEDTPNSVSTSTYFALELPTMAQFDEAMELWLRYFFVFSVRIPEVVPTVFQCTHHGVGSLFGMLLKLRRGTTYMIWDHAIYWRESCLNVSSSQCILSLSVQNMLLGAIKMASHLCYTHADVILPCTNLFNPGWEADIGSDQGRRQNKVGFARKIDPVVNGISEMERFEPVDKIQSENPTVMMLSNVQFIKDVKNAVYSADIIVNRFKFTKYRLVIYGAMDRTPQYTAETELIIKSRKLENNVKLAGFGNPKEILKDAWAFMNSSLSEGLPLAIGEAALSGCPVIATDVGATALVISDPKDPKIRYGEIVPPNDSVALARAQIQILAMLGPWTKYCGDSPPPMPEIFTTEDVDWITQRMYDKTEERRALGRKGRETVLHSFNGNRYLREHEQMYWLGSYRAKQRADPALQQLSGSYIKFDETLAIQPIILSRKSKLWDEDPWRYFEHTDGIINHIKTGLLHMKKRFKRHRAERNPDVTTELSRFRRVSESNIFSIDESREHSKSVSRTFSRSLTPSQEDAEIVTLNRTDSDEFLQYTTTKEFAEKFVLS